MEAHSLYAVTTIAGSGVTASEEVSPLSEVSADHMSVPRETGSMGPELWDQQPVDGITLASSNHESDVAGSAAPEPVPTREFEEQDLDLAQEHHRSLPFESSNARSSGTGEGKYGARRCLEERPLT